MNNNDGFWLDNVNEMMHKLVPNGDVLFETKKDVEHHRQERKEQFRQLHEKAATADEDVMKRYYGIESNHNKPVRIDEVTLNRVLDKHGDNGMINISANRSDSPKDVNDKNTQSLINDLKRSGYSYLPVYGGYRGTDGVEDDYEPSFVVFNYDVNGHVKNFSELQTFAIELCGKYDQDSVLIKAPGKAPIYLDRNGNKANERESNKVLKNDPKQAYFTSMKSKDEVDDEVRNKLMGKYKSYCHQNNLPVTKDGFEKFYNEHLNDVDSVGGRYTYDIAFECYVNPMPCHLTERMKRKGEIMVWE